MDPDRDAARNDGDALDIGAERVEPRIRSEKRLSSESAAVDLGDERVAEEAGRPSMPMSISGTWAAIRGPLGPGCSVRLTCATAVG